MKKTFLSIIAVMTSTIVMANDNDLTKTSSSHSFSNRANNTFNVGQIYVGGNIGCAIPMGIKKDDNVYAFNDFAKAGFVISADGMYQMSQAIGVGAEVGFRTYPQKDDGAWSGLTKYGVIDASYNAIDLGLTGRLFFSKNSVRPFFGVAVGGELLINECSYTPNANSGETSWDYKTTNVSPAYGVMAGAYFKMQKRTLLSLQARFSMVPKLKEGTITSSSETIARNPHGNQHNITVTFGIHIGTQGNNKY